MKKAFRYKQVEQELEDQIISGQYSPGDRIEPTEELEKHFNASRITINRALGNLSERGLITRTPGKGSIVTEASRWNRHKKSLSAGSMVGAIVFDSSSPYLWAKAIRGLEGELSRSEFNLVIGNDEGNVDRALNYVSRFESEGIGGYVLVPIGQRTEDEYRKENLRLIRAVEETGRPYLLLHRHLDEVQSPVIALENYKDAARLTQVLLESGTENPICLSHYYDSVVDERERAFRDKIEEAGFSNVNERIRKIWPTGQRVTSETFGQVEEALYNDSSVDGVLCISADLLNLALRVTDTHDGDNTERFRFVSHDYDELLFSHPSVKAMNLPPAEDLGSLAGETILRIIRENTSLPTRTLLPSRLICKPTDSDGSSSGEEMPGNYAHGVRQWRAAISE